MLELGLIGGIGLAAIAPAARAADAAAQREARGDLAAAHTLLEQDAKSGGAGAGLELAEFTDRHATKDRRDALVEWAASEQDPARKQTALRQIVLLDFQQGRSSSLAEDLNRYKAAGGNDFALAKPLQNSTKYFAKTTIPGPLHSFARMAALSPDLAPEALLPALARNVVTNGYQAMSSNEALDQTEYLRLLIRYIGQARELTTLAGTAKKIVVATCDSEQAGDLLKILGYRMRGSCGGDVVLETVNPTRAFLTVDSGFPIAELEQNLRANRKFEYAFVPTEIPVLYGPDYWMAAATRGNHPDFIDAFLNDPSLCRLYLGLSKLSSPTADAMRRRISETELKLYAPVLDFFGSQFEIHNGVAYTPGSERAWADLAGAKRAEGAAFYQKILESDDGWLASYFDALARLDSPASAYLLEPERMKRFYGALRGKVTTPGPARPVFRSSTDLLLLTTSLRLDANGEAHIPGGIEAWKTLFIKHPHGKYDSRLTRAAASWRSPDDLLEALFGLCRKSVENEPLHIFLTLNDVDRGRERPLSTAIASRLIADYRMAGAQYSILADVPSISENSIGMFLDYVKASGEIRDTLVRADSVGSAQALLGIWQILCRGNQISGHQQDMAFAAILNPFLKARQSAEVFDAARSGVKALLEAANTPASGAYQSRLIDLLVGAPHATAPDRMGPAENFVRVIDAQRLLSLDKIYAVADTLGQATPNKKVLESVDSELARFEEAQSLRNSLSGAERNLVALGYWSERHIDQERKLDLDALAKANDRKDARGKMTPFLRDTLVGMLYAYYSPDGAQLVYANPMFVRNHDFIGAQGLTMTWRTTEVVGSGWPASAGGRLMGSLSSLPYVIAEAEQNFLSPTREQALIWGDLVPQIIVDVTVPRWRHVSSNQVRWAALNMRRGEDLLAVAAFSTDAETKVLASLGRFASPARLEQIDARLHSGDYAGARTEVLPAEFYALATDPRLTNVEPDIASMEIAAMKATNDSSLSTDAIAEAFGTPKPTLTHSYRPGLLYLRTFPTLMGYSSRLLAETWESNGFYYAALADEVGIPADQLEFYVPEWTRATIENIFATHLEDWPALLRSLRTVGDNVVRERTGVEKAALNALNQSSN